MIREFENIQRDYLCRLGEHSGRVRPAYTLIVFGILAASVIMIATALVLWELRVKELTNAEREIANLSPILSEQTARAAQSVDLILRGIEERLYGDEVGHLPVEREILHALLRARIAGVPQIRSLSVIDANGSLAYTSREFPAATVSAGDQDYFAVHRDNPGRGLYIGKPARNRSNGAWTTQMSRRLSDPNDEFRGVISATIDLGYFDELYKSIKLGEGSTISLFLRDGTLIASQPRRENLVGKSFAGSPIFRALGEKSGFAARTAPLRTTDSSPLIISYQEVSGFPLVVAVAVSETTALAGWRHQAILIASGAAGVVLILALAAVVLAKQLARDEALTGALRDSEARLHGIIGSAMDAIITVDQNQRIVLFNSAAEKMFRCSSTEALGAPFDRFLPERYRTAHRRHMECFGKTGLTARAMGEQVEIIGLRTNGEEFPVDASISRVTTGGKNLYTAVVRDITKRRQGEEELRKSHQQLRELSASLQSVREEERARIARELHDELGQQLTGLKMDLSWIAARLRNDQAGVFDKIVGMKKQIDATVGSVRRIASELRPLMLDDLGLVAAVEWLVQEFSKRTGIEVSMNLRAEDFDPGDSLATAVFRILQESLTNVARHAEATRVHVSLEYRGEQLTVKVQDDGKGISSGAACKTSSFGLIGIRERAYMLGGQAHISSQPKAGTTIEITVPVLAPVPRERVQ